MKSKIGIVCAGDQEVAPFLRLIDECSVSEKAMLKFYHGKIEDVEIVTLFCGVCKTNAAIATQILIDTYGCNAIFNAGTAGGMDEKIQLFDTVVSTESAYWDVSAGILTEFHPFMKTIFFSANQELISIAKVAISRNRLSNVYFGTMITGETFIEDEHRNEINMKLPALCVDMETASIAHTCYVNEIPFIAVRTITDTAEHGGVEAFEQNCDRASQISANVVIAILKEIAHGCGRSVFHGGDLF